MNRINYPQSKLKQLFTENKGLSSKDAGGGKSQLHSSSTQEEFKSNALNICTFFLLFISFIIIIFGILHPAIVLPNVMVNSGQSLQSTWHLYFITHYLFKTERESKSKASKINVGINSSTQKVQIYIYMYLQLSYVPDLQSPYFSISLKHNVST